MPTYTVQSDVKALSVVTRLVAPSFSQDTCHSFLKGAQAREFAKELRYSSVETALIIILGLPSIYTGIFAGVYTAYKQSIIDKIIDYSDLYPGVYVKTIKSSYGTFYAVEPWTDTTKATVTLTNSDSATERVLDVIYKK